MKKNKLYRRILATALSVAMIVGLMPLSAVAETLAGGGEIISFEKLPEATSNQLVALGTDLQDLNLPDTLSATIRVATTMDADEQEESGQEPEQIDEEQVPKSEEPEQIDEEQVQESEEPEQVAEEPVVDNEEPQQAAEEPVVEDKEPEQIAEEQAQNKVEYQTVNINVPVTWNSAPEYDGDTAGTYVFSPVLPENYTLEDGVSLPTIKVDTKTKTQTLPMLSAPLSAPTEEPATTINDVELPNPILNAGTYHINEYPDDTKLVIGNGNDELKGVILQGTNNTMQLTIKDKAEVTFSGVSIKQESESGDYSKHESGVTIDGTATIMLASGTTNTVISGGGYCAGINVESEKSLTIDGTGMLEVESGFYGAGIGGGGGKYIGNNCGTIIINDGTVKAKGIRQGAGIGGGGGSDRSGDGGTIIINGGMVTAIGSQGAGIGGGEGDHGSGGKITIKGGTVMATSGYAAGIGGGYNNHDGGTIKILGGIVKATADSFSAGIGGGRNCEGGSIVITGGTVEAIGGKYGGAGIGGGYGGSGGTVTISNGTVEAIGGTNGGAGIGGGYGGSGSTVTISNGAKVYASGDTTTDNTEDIGHGGSRSSTEDSGSLTISGKDTKVFVGGSTKFVKKGDNYKLNDGIEWTTNSAIISNAQGTAPNKLFDGKTIGGAYFVLPPESAGAPTIDTQPIDISCDMYETKTVSVTAGSPDGGTLSYQWYSNTTDSNSDGSEIKDATDKTYTVPTDTAGTYYYYCVVTNTNNSATSEKKTATAISDAVKVEVQLPNPILNAGTYHINEYPDDTKLVVGNGNDELTGVILQGTNNTMQLTIKDKADVTFDGVSIQNDTVEECAVTIDGTSTITLKDGSTNTLQSGGYRAGINVPDGSCLFIDGTGELTAIGDSGIGGNYECKSGNINITGGIVTAYGGGGAGIGGGLGGDCGTVNITGGIVSASGDGAGIGGGYADMDSMIGGNGGAVAISNGAKVYAVTRYPYSCEDIGKGYKAKNSGSLTISGTNTKVFVGGSTEFPGTSDNYKLNDGIEWTTNSAIISNAQGTAPNKLFDGKTIGGVYVGAVYKDLTQEEAPNEDSAQKLVKAVAEKAVNDETVEVTITNVDYKEATAGTSANPKGTNGSYSFTVTMKKGDQSATTEKITVAIIATEYTDQDAVNDAKKAAVEATYKDLTQEEAPNKDSAQKLVKAVAENAVNDKTVKVTITDGDYKEATAGTSANPKGTNGSYSFTVTVKKGDQSATTETKSVAITATPYDGEMPVLYSLNYDEATKVYTTQTVAKGSTTVVPTTPKRAGYTFGGWYKENACENAWNFKDNTVQKSMTLYAKWTKKSVDTLEVTYMKNGATSGKVPKGHTNYKSGDTVTVLGNVGSLSKNGASFEGWSDGTTTYKEGDTFKITANTVLTAVWKAEDIKCNVTYSNNYAGGGTYTTKTAAYGSLLTKPASPTREGYSFIGWYKNAACTNPWNFDLDTVTGDTTLYTKWAQGTYSVSGTVEDDTNPTPNKVDGATVKIMKGNVQFGDSVLTDANGKFTVTGIPNGEYNIVITKNGQMVTLHITVDGSDFNYEGEITLPSGNKNSKLDIVGSDTPNVVEDGLDSLFKDTDIYDKKSEDAVNNGGTVEIRLTVQKNDNSIEKNKVSAQMSSEGYESGIMLDVDIEKTVTDNTGAVSDQSQITALDDALTLIIPLPAELQGKSNYVVYRTHDYGGTTGVKVDKITITPNADNEYIEISADKTYLTLHAKFFSTYAIGYSDSTGGSTGGSSSGHSSGHSTVANTNSYTINVTEGKDGSISPSGSVAVEKGKDKTFTFTPNEGYIISDVLIDGKSVGAVDSYTFKNMDAAHTISVKFAKAEGLPYYMNSKGNKVFIGFASSSTGTMKYIAPEGEKVQLVQNAKNFNDINRHWAKTDIDFVTQREIFVGTTNDTFSPNSGMTRAMFATVIGRLYERSYGNISANGNTFTDVSDGMYYSTYVAWAEKNGIIKGIGNSKFAPNRKISREEMTAIIYRFAEYLKVSQGSLETKLGYTDVSKIDNWAIESIKYCKENKIVLGRDDGSFDPQDTATRAEVSTIIKRFVDTVVQ